VGAIIVSSNIRKRDVGDENSLIALGVLNSVHKDAHVTQRTVSKEVGIALGLTNSYLKRFIRKGLIKIRQTPAKRYAYYLTPQGFAEKSRLTAEYLSQGFHFFRITHEECERVYTHCHNRGWKKLALHGLTEIAEIALLTSAQFDLEVVAVIDADTSLTVYSGVPVVKSISQVNDIDAVLIADLDGPEYARASLEGALPAERLLVLEVYGSVGRNIKDAIV